MANFHRGASTTRVRRFRRTVALTLAALALCVSSSVALAAGLTVGLATPTTRDLLCDPFLGCSATVSGNLTGSTPGTYSLQFTLAGIPDATFNDSALRSGA